MPIDGGIHRMQVVSFTEMGNGFPKVCITKCSLFETSRFACNPRVATLPNWNNLILCFMFCSNKGRALLGSDYSFQLADYKLTWIQLDIRPEPFDSMAFESVAFNGAQWC